MLCIFSFIPDIDYLNQADIFDTIRFNNADHKQTQRDNDVAPVKHRKHAGMTQPLTPTLTLTPPSTPTPTLPSIKNDGAGSASADDAASPSMITATPFWRHKTNGCCGSDGGGSGSCGSVVAVVASSDNDDDID